VESQFRTGGLRGASGTLLEGAGALEQDLLQQLQGAVGVGGVDSLRAMGTWNTSTRRSQNITLAAALERTEAQSIDRLLKDWT
jgi:hypothetical protein